MENLFISFIYLKKQEFAIRAQRYYHIERSNGDEDDEWLDNIVFQHHTFPQVFNIESLNSSIITFSSSKLFSSDKLRR